MKTIRVDEDSTVKVGKAYVKPAIEVIEMKVEGILCASGDDLSPGGGYNF